ncbi:MAG: NUDIX domain-containing protein [Alphaproteobacteria bacterium]|nr:NUDIX domain-containing protein [Alphaproteobacteria bacterium]
MVLTAVFPVYRRWRVWRGRKLGGAFVAIRAADDVLVVRHSYRPRLDFVGGGIEPGESPRDAAVREVREEIGLAPPPRSLRELGRVRRGFRRVDETDTVFEWRVATLPPVAVSGREVVWAGGLRTLPLNRRDQAITVRWYLRRFAPELAR